MLVRSIVRPTRAAPKRPQQQGLLGITCRSRQGRSASPALRIPPTPSGTTSANRKRCPIRAVGGRVLLASYTSRLPHERQFFVVSILSCSHVFGLYQCCYACKDPISFRRGKGNIVLLNTVFVRWGQSVFFNGMPQLVFFFMSKPVFCLCQGKAPITL